MDPEITLVTLGVSNLDAAIQFYHEELGFPLHHRETGRDVAFFPLDGSWLSLYPRDKLAADAAVEDAGDGFAGVTLAHTVGTKAEVEEILDAAASATGGRLVKSAEKAFWGGYSGYFADPDDHLWEVAYPKLTDEV